MKILLSFLLVINNAFANQCKEPVSILNEGDKAPCTGFLFSPEQEKIAAQAYDDSKYLQKINDKLEKRIDLYNEQIDVLEKRLDLYIKQSEILAKQNIQQSDNNFWKNTLYFSLGVLATGIAFYGTSKLK